MGINIGLVLSNHISKERWQSVYDEALKLAQKLGLADLTKQCIHGQVVKCLTITGESEHYKRVGWRAVADYKDRDGAEWFTMYRDLPEYDNEQRHDILAEYSYYIINLPGMEEPKGTFQEMWGAKTQGKSYHASLLAVGCLVQDRLGDDAMVKGDYTAGQCRVAVKMANQFLKQPIQVPCQCDPERWIDRIGRMDVKEDYLIRIAIGMYYGRLDASFGERLRTVFSHDGLNEYWRSRFASYRMSQVGFSLVLHDYLTMGFDVAELCELVKFTNGEETSINRSTGTSSMSNDGDDGKAVGVERFIKHIMDAKLHWKEVDTTDIMVQDPEDPTLYGIEAMMVRGLSMGARNKKIDRYIPIEELRKILVEKLPGDVDGIIDAYLAREKELENDDTTMGRLERDCSAEINRVMEERKDAIVELSEKYQIYEEELLVDYKPGDGITPALETLLAKIMQFTASIPVETMESVEQKQEWLAENHDHIPPFKDTDWEWIFSRIEEEPNCFARYYPLFRIDLRQRIVSEAVVALILNDDLYEFAKTLSFKE